MVYSYGKTLLTPGQSIGYFALSPQIEDAEELRPILYSSQILCGWAMASALMQHALPELEKFSLDVKELQHGATVSCVGCGSADTKCAFRRARFTLLQSLQLKMIWSFQRSSPSRVFFVCRAAWLACGYLRASITASDEMIDRALPIFAAARKQSKSVRSDITNPSERGVSCLGTATSGGLHHANHQW